MIKSIMQITINSFSNKKINAKYQNNRDGIKAIMRLPGERMNSFFNL